MTNQPPTPPVSPPLLHRFRGSRSNLAIVAGLCLAVSGAVTAIAVSSPGRNSETQTPVVIELAALEAQAEASTEPELFMREAQIRPGDTVPALMAELGINDAALRTYLINDPDASRIVRRLRPGMIIESATDREGALSWLSLRSPGSELATRIQRGSDTDFALEDYTLDVQTTEQFAQGSIQSSLFAATDAQGLPDALALSMADIFASQIDFNTDLRRDDRFTVVYESMEFRGEQLKSGRIKAVEFVNAGKRYTAFWFDEGNGRGAYFDANGQSLRKGFLRSPLEFTRISSGFSNNRKHPLFKDIRAHRGTDFAAPTGTRVRASSDGRVEFVGSQRGYGNFIVLKHDGGYTTAYGHLNGFAKGLRKGQAVSQGDVIGFVGATGWATGPHLHYEFRKNNVHQDPMRVDLPGRPPLTGGRLQAFKAQNASLIARLENASVQVAQKD